MSCLPREQGDLCKKEQFIFREHRSIETNTIFIFFPPSYLIHRNVFPFPLESSIIYMEQLASKNDKQIFTLIQKGNVCIIVHTQMGPLGRGEAANHTMARPYCGVTCLPQEERLQD